MKLSDDQYRFLKETFPAEDVTTLSVSFNTIEALVEYILKERESKKLTKNKRGQKDNCTKNNVHNANIDSSNTSLTIDLKEYISSTQKVHSNIFVSDICPKRTQSVNIYKSYKNEYLSQYPNYSKCGQCYYHDLFYDNDQHTTRKRFYSANRKSKNNERHAAYSSNYNTYPHKSSNNKNIQNENDLIDNLDSFTLTSHNSKNVSFYREMYAKTKDMHYNYLASIEILSTYRDTIDFHGLYVYEALMFIMDYTRIIDPYKFTIVVGNSEKIRPRAEALLDDLGYNCFFNKGVLTMTKKKK